MVRCGVRYGVSGKSFRIIRVTYVTGSLMNYRGDELLLCHEFLYLSKRSVVSSTIPTGVMWEHEGSIYLGGVGLGGRGARDPLGLPVSWRRGGLQEMAFEVHRIVEESDNLHSAGADPIEQNVPRGPALLGDVAAANARADIVVRLPTARIVRDDFNGLSEKLAVLAGLDDPPTPLRVYENLDDIAVRSRRTDYSHRARATRLVQQRRRSRP